MKLAIRCVIAAAAYVVGLVVSGALAPALHIPTIPAPAGVNPAKLILLLVLASPLLAFSMAPLAEGMRGRWSQRWFALALLLYITIGLNTLLELKIFSSMLSGNPWAASLLWLLPCAATGAVLALPMAARDEASRMTPFGIGWAWRLTLAWLAFPVCYFLFGMIIAPIVVPYYKGHSEFGLIIPPLATILRTLALRSALFLAASMPAIVLWRKSRLQFIVAMGLAHAFSVGIFQLAQATFLPAVLRVTHSLEITADSFAYAAALGLLFIAREPARVRAPEREMAMAGSR